MKIDLDIPVNIGDSIFLFDEVSPEADVTDITVVFERGKEKPTVIIGWAQYDVGPDVTELWDEGDVYLDGLVYLDDLGTTFWFTYEDMVKANRKKLTEYQLATDQAFKSTYGEEIKECSISKQIGCDGCEYGNICQYQNKELL